jgi:copper transport protein
VTAVLVASQPARDAYAAPYSRTLAGPNLTVQVTVDPAHTGLSTIHLYTENSQGSPTPLTSVTGALRLPARDVGPLPVAFTRLAPNHAQAASDFAVPGRWLLDLTVQTSPVDATTFRLPVTVR